MEALAVAFVQPLRQVFLHDDVLEFHLGRHGAVVVLAALVEVAGCPVAVAGPFAAQRFVGGIRHLHPGEALHQRLVGLRLLLGLGSHHHEWQRLAGGQRLALAVLALERGLQRQPVGGDAGLEVQLDIERLRAPGD